MEDLGIQELRSLYQMLRSKDPESIQLAVAILEQNKDLYNKCLKVGYYFYRESGKIAYTVGELLYDNPEPNQLRLLKYGFIKVLKELI